MTDSLYEFKKCLSKRGIFFCFSGPISQELLVELGATLKQKMKLEEASSSTVLRVFSMVVEKSQNIIHYSAEKISKDPTGKDELSFGIIAVGYENEHYFVMCGNLMKNEDVPRLQEKLIRLEKMNKEELKAYYKEQRKKDPDKGSRGAGLGLIEMAKKADRPIEFYFRKIDENISFFSSKTVI